MAARKMISPDRLMYCMIPFSFWQTYLLKYLFTYKLLAVLIWENELVEASF